MDNKTKLPRYISLIIVLVVFAFIFFIGSVNVKIVDEKLEVSATLTPKTQVNLEDITGVHLLDEWNDGARNFGIGSRKLSAGTFSNSQAGSYKLYILKDVKKYILLQYKDDANVNIVVFNYKNEEETINLYNELRPYAGIN